MPENKSLERRFKEFKDKQTAKDFRNVDFLEEQAELIRSDDAELADRILQRVKNLKQQALNRENASLNPANNVIVDVGAGALSSLKAEAPKTVKPMIVAGSLQKKIKTPFNVFVVLPTLLFAFYQFFWASDRYESQAQVIVQQPDSAATLDASMALLSGLGVSTSSGSDPHLLEAYINSNDMLNYLNEKLNLKQYYSQSKADVFSRLDADATQESFLKYYQNHIKIEIDEKSSVISISAQSFDQQFAQDLTEQIVARSEWYINNIGHQLAEAQLSFIKVEHQLDEDKLKKAQVTLLDFQQKYRLLDPTAEGAAMQQIAYGIEGQIAAKEAELKAFNNIMSEDAPQVRAAANELEALRKQLVNERSKLAEDDGSVVSVGEILAKYTDLKVAMEMALQSYTSSKISLEKSRIEAYRQLKYLITVQAATKPEKSAYPDSFYNVSLFFVLTAMLFAIVRIIYAVVHELK